MGCVVERAAIFWLLCDLVTRRRIFTLFSFHEHRAAQWSTFPSCYPPALHISPMWVVGGKEGGSHERFLWCCRKFCYAVTQICEGSCSSSSAVARHWDNVPYSVFHSPLFFSVLLALWSCSHHHFQALQPVFSHSAWCGTSVATLWGWARSGQAMAWPHQTAWAPLSGFCLFRAESHFWCCHIVLARVPVKRCIKSPERFWLGKR